MKIRICPCPYQVRLFFENTGFIRQTGLCGFMVFGLQNCFQSFLVVAEKPAMGLGVSLAAGLTNMVLDFLFIYVFGLGVFGAALATGISQFIGAMIPIFYFARKNKSPC